MQKSLQSKSRRLEGLPVSSSKASQHQPGARIKASTEALLLLGKYVMEGRDCIPACAVIVFSLLGESNAGVRLYVRYAQEAKSRQTNAGFIHRTKRQPASEKNPPYRLYRQACNIPYA